MASFNRTGVQNSYTHRVRIANWSEDQELMELKMKEFLHRKATGQLLINSVRKHLNASLQEVGLSHSPDGYIHFGDCIMIYSANTEGVLSVDVSEKVAGANLAYSVTTSTLTKAHVARNTFVIEPYNKNDRTGDVLCLGQQFRLRASPLLLPDPCPFYLHSQPVTPQCASKISRHQQVTVQSTTSYDTVWNCSFKDGTKRFEMEGEPVPANAELLFFHCLTGQALASSPINYYNDFGLEYEVCAHTYNRVNKKQGLFAELKGMTTADVPSRREGAPNHFAFLTASDPASEASLADAAGSGDANAAAAATKNSQRRVLSAVDVMAKFRNILLGGGRASGPSALHALYGMLRAGDGDGTGFVHRAVLLNALVKAGIHLSPQETELLAAAYSHQGTVMINYLEFVTRLRGEPNQRRTALVRLAFAAVDTARVGVVTIARIVSVFDPSRHPQVLSGQVTASQARSVLARNLEAYADADGRVSALDFANYYGNVGAFVDNDDVYANMLCKAWNIYE